MRQITPINNHGSIQLKFSFGGHRYSLSPISGGDYDSPSDLKAAQAIASQISLDILSGHFDVTLDSYKRPPRTASVHPKTLPKSSTLLDLWDLWVNSLELSEETVAGHYRCIRQMLVKAKPSLVEADWLRQSRLSPSSYNKRLGYLRSCFDWAVAKGITESNPYADLKPRRGSPRKPKPFTQDEIRAILGGFQRLSPGYLGLVRLLFGTGVRSAEAVGLRWADVDLDRAEVTIGSSLPRDRTGDGYKTIRKQTKTGSVRVLGLTEDLLELLTVLRPSQVDPDSLVFTSGQGKVISWDNFSRRHWKPVLEAQGVPYRNPYQTRHSFASHAITLGVPLTDIAYMLGHQDITMLVKHYGHCLGRPKLPDLGL